MKIASYISALAIAILLLANMSSSVVAAGQAKHPPKQHSKITNKPSTNQNAQWSADPDRGWVRSDESHTTQRSDRLSTFPKETDGKNKGSGKASKRF